MGGLSPSRITTLAALLILMPPMARAVEPSLPPAYVYTTQKLYADILAADRAGWLANDFKNPNKAAESEARDARARAYIDGVADALNDKRFCAPPGSDRAGVVGPYIKAHMDLWNRPAVFAVEQALVDAFPCREVPTSR